MYVPLYPSCTPVPGGIHTTVPRYYTSRAFGVCSPRSRRKLYTNSVIFISEIHSEFSDSIQFMQIHTEFRYDPPQDRACEGGEARQEWVELEAWRSVADRGTRYSGSTRRGQSSYRIPRVGRCWQPSYTVPNSVHFEAQKLGVPALVPCNNSY